MITVEMVREKGFDVTEGDNVWRDIVNEFIPISRVEARWIKEKIINSCSAIKEFAWRDNKGEMPCDGELWVEICDSLIRQAQTYKACNIYWEEDLKMKWRPSLKNWESEMNLDKIETQEEKEAFEGMANSSEVPNGSEWKNGDECIYMSHKVVQQFVGPCPKREGYGYIQAPTFEINFVELSKLSKPETPEQKYERERLEFIDSMFVELNPRDVKELYEGHRNSSAWKLCAKAYDAGYRKQNG